MLGIPGLDPFGLAHALIGIAALLMGLVVVMRPKGDASHRVCGAAYVVAMVLLNASALAMYDLTGRLNAFHVFALISLATLAAGWVPALRRRPARRWYERHAMFMAWSYVGLVAAFVSEIVTRIPVFSSGAAFGAAVAGTAVAILGAGAIVIHWLVPPAVARVAGSD